MDIRTVSIAVLGSGLQRIVTVLILLGRRVALFVLIDFIAVFLFDPLCIMWSLA